jgi:hypothetical protein
MIKEFLFRHWAVAVLGVLIILSVFVSRAIIFLLFFGVVYAVIYIWKTGDKEWFE